MSGKWYVIKTRSEYEKKVKAAIEKKVNDTGSSDKIFKVVVPAEEVVEVRRNKKVIRERPYFTGYVFVNMDLNHDSYWIVRNITGVSGFLGGTHPVPLNEDEVKNLTGLMEQPAQSKPRQAINFEREESVRITEGPFRHFVGVVEDINEEKGKLKVMVTIFGRPTPVELDYFQVEKM